MRHMLAQLCRLLLEWLERDPPPRDLMIQIHETYERPTYRPMTKKNLWRADRDSGRAAVLPYRVEKRDHP